MAIRERKGRAKPWQVYWNNPFTGKRESAAFETRQEAEKEDSLVKHRLKFERESFRQEEKTDAKNEITLEYVYIQYLREKQFREKMLSAHVSMLRPVLEQIGKLRLDEIGKKALENLFSRLRQGKAKLVTDVQRMKRLNTVLRWAADREYCKPIPFPRLPQAHYEKFIPPTQHELQIMLDAAAPHIKRVIILGAFCGVRIGPCELFQLTWEDVDLYSGILRIHGSKKNANSPWREVPIRENLLPVIEEWKKEDMNAGVKYLISYKGKPVKRIDAGWKYMLHMAGITRRIRPYDLRHAFATELIAAGTDIGTVAKLMGHSGPTMLLTHYQYVMDDQKRKAVEKLPDFMNVPKSMCPGKRKWKTTKQIVEIRKKIAEENLTRVNTPACAGRTLSNH